ncbi:MAG: DNA polymerase I [Chloroflexota bacterium]
MPPTLYLLDGHALAYRAYFALTRGAGSFSTRSGEPTAGTFGFTSILLRLFEQERPEYLAVAFDTGKTFRDQIFPAYKGTRAKMPDDLRPQIGRIRQVVDAFHIPRLEVEGYEADDVLGSVARSAVALGYGVKIITGDRDLLQLVEERILVNLPGRNISDAKDYRTTDVLDYLGVRPGQVVDYKALVGDKSDNIPGVPGIGEKTAIGLLQKYGTLDEVYQHLDELAAGVRGKLEAGRESSLLSRKLATIVTDVPVALDVEDARTGQFDPQGVDSLFRELEFLSLLNRLETVKQVYGLGSGPGQGYTAPVRGQQLALFGPTETVVGAPSRPPDGNEAYEVVDTPAALDALVERLQAAAMIAFDTETTSTHEMSAELVGISLAVDGERGYYLPVGHRLDRDAQLPLEQVIAALRRPLTDPHIAKAGHNLKYDYIILARYGLAVTPLAFDTMIAEWLVNPTSRNLGLKGLSWARLGRQMTEIETLIGKGKNQITMADVPIEQAAAYAAADASTVMQLVPQLQDDMQKAGVTGLFNDIEMPLIPVLADMEMAGIALDADFLAQMSGELETRLREIESQVYAAVGETFNLNSTQQLSTALFDRLKLPPPGGARRTASGHYSTAADVLESLRGRHPAVDLVLENRELSKLKSTYVDALPLQVNPVTRRVHTSYSQTGAVTGRLSSSDPNLQNIPARTELGQKVRKAFVAARDHLLLAVDYSQVELRIVAHMSQDGTLLSAFRAGQDIHSATAAAIYGISLDQVTKAMRRAAKSINFGLIYGMSAFGLTRSSELTLAEAEDFVKAYFEQFPGVKRYLDGMRRQAAEQGYVETLLGRRRYFPTLKNERNPQVRAREEREAINAPVQGTAADIMKIAMLQVPAALQKAGLSARMLLQVHDELVLECKTTELAQAAATIQDVMENAYTLSIPLKTEARCGQNWGQMKPLEE